MKISFVCTKGEQMGECDDTSLYTEVEEMGECDDNACVSCG